MVEISFPFFIIKRLAIQLAFIEFLKLHLEILRKCVIVCNINMFIVFVGELLNERLLKLCLALICYSIPQNITSYFPSDYTTFRL